MRVRAAKESERAAEMRAARLERTTKESEPAAQIAEAQPVPPHPYCCHITYEVMTDPVVTKYGYTYERTNIERHIEAYNTDPLTGLPLTVSDLVPNFSLRDAIEYYNLHFIRFLVPLYPRRNASP
eukprot:gene9251-16401_t